MTYIRMTPKARKDELLQAAVEAAAKHGWATVTRAQIAAEAGVSDALVTTRLGPMPDVRRAIMREAIKQRLPRIVAAGLALGDKLAAKAPDDLKDAARKAL